MNHNSSYSTEQDDCDEMSGYRKAQQQAAKKHKEIKKESIWQPIIVAIILFTLMWWMSGCTIKRTISSEELITSDSVRLKYEDLSSVITIVTVDNCEYIVYHGYNKGGIIHKENCPNPIHK